MPAPLGYTAYRDNNIALAKAAKSVATKSMHDAAAELHKNSSEPITQCAVSCDGTWQRRGHASLNGCVTTLSIDSGKCLDVEILTKVCHGCQKIEREEDAAKKADLQERQKCKANYQGSAPSMEVEGVKRIFKRSEQTRKLQYTEYFGDGDSKAYEEVQDCYENIHIEKKAVHLLRILQWWGKTTKGPIRAVASIYSWGGGGWGGGGGGGCRPKISE